MTKGQRILVADDTPEIRDILEIFLTRLGHEVKAVADGEELLVSLKADPPDAVLLDLDLPKRSGLEVLEWIRAQELDLKIVVISGHAQEDAAKASLEKGASDFIMKPFDLKYLETSLTSLLMAS